MLRNWRSDFPEYAKNCIRYLKMTVDSNDAMILSTGRILNYYQKNLIWYAGGDLSDYKGDAVSYGFNTIDDGQFDKVLSCTFASGCCMFGKSKLFQNMMFSKDYFLYFEDVGFCKELYKSGYKIIYNPKVIIYHKESASTKKIRNCMCTILQGTDCFISMKT